MIGRASRLLGVVLAALLAASLAPRAFAEDHSTVPLDRKVGRGMSHRVRADVTSLAGCNRPGGYGQVRVGVVNPSEKPHVVGIRLSGGGYRRSGRCRIRRTLHLDPGQQAVADLPLLGSNWGMELAFTLDGREVEETLTVGSSSRTRGAALAALFVTARPLAADWRRALDTQVARAYGRSGAHALLQTSPPEDLPGTWAYISAFDLVVVDARAPGLTPERRTTLLRYARGGGNLVVHGIGSTTTGPLASLRARGAKVEGGTWAGRVGLGRWILFEEGIDAHSAPLQTWMEARGATRLGVLGRIRGVAGGGAPPALWWPLQIPGLGEVPVKAFFVLILAFVLLVGPANYIWFRRRRRLPMLLVTVPLLGFLCTAVILGYGFFSEGFGVTGAARSFSVLDQPSKQAATTTERTLYAGLEPSMLACSTDTWLASTSFHLEQRGPDNPQVMYIDLDAGQRFEGGVMPSRTPTTFVTTTVSRSRERLRFRRRAEGGFEVLATPGFRPTARDGSVILCTAKGAYYVGDGAGRLQRLAQGSREIRDRIEALVHDTDAMPLGAGDAITGGYWGSWVHWLARKDMRVQASSSVRFSSWVLDRVGSLPNGAYLAEVTRPPIQGELGLDVTYRAEHHVVLGILGPEDVIDE